MHRNKSVLLRKMFEDEKVIRVIGAHDALSAKLAEESNFDAIWASGLGISASNCFPDASILDMSEFLSAAKSMNRSTNIPIIADCDSGFGDVNNIIRMVREYESIGIAAVCIEDKPFPKRNSFLEGQQLADVTEFSLKIQAAKNAQSTKDFMVFARIESLIVGTGINDAINRAIAYTSAGADGILIHSKSSNSEEIFTFCKEYKKLGINIPIIVVPTTYYNVTEEELANRNIKMVIYANQLLRASMEAMKSTLLEIGIDKSTRRIEDKITSIKEVFRVIGTNELNENEKWFEEELVSRELPI